jgi:Mg-chelatase subunit ChlD
MYNELTWAKKRQIIIVTGLSFIFLLIVSITLYNFLKKPATCFDNKQNQNETGVDCGGVCSAICKADSKSLVIDWVRLFKIREGEYSVIAQIENPAVNSIAREVPYTFSLRNKSGDTVTTRSGKTFIPARKTFVVFEGTIDTQASPESVFFQFDQEPNWQKSSYIEPNLVISNKELINIDSLPRMNATVQNPNIVSVKNVTLSALIYDDGENVVQVSQTFIENLKAGDSANIVFTWPQPISLKSRICESPVDASLVIDRSGSMEYLGKNPQQPLTDVKNAADSFVSELSKYDQASVVSFANTASDPADVSLSGDLSAVKNAIDSISILTPTIQNTNIGDGLQKGLNELLSQKARQESGKILVLLTDGVANLPYKKGNTKYPENYALSVAKNAKDQNTRIFTIGLGKDLHQDFLKQIASSPTDFYLAPTAKELTAIYREIGTKMCKRKPTALEIVTSIPN